jgi:hypothetical protein
MIAPRLDQVRKPGIADAMTTARPFERVEAGAAHHPNRHARRREVVAFRAEIAAMVLTTHLIDADDLHDMPHAAFFERAVADWRARRRSQCICCKEVVDDPGAFLFAHPSGAAVPTSASVSAICRDCWRDLPMAEIEVAATRLLRKILPRGAFIDAPKTEPPPRAVWVAGSGGP